MSETLIIAGAGHAAGQLVTSLLQQSYAGRIVLLGEESWLPYQRPPLSKKFLAGDIGPERLFVKPAAFYEDERIELLLGTQLERIDRETRRIHTNRGQALHYDKLVLALGAEPRRLDLPGIDLAGVSYLRNIADVEAIRKSLEHAGKLTIVGAGYIGLEVAAVVSAMGVEVTVIEAQDRVMSRVVAPEVSAFYQDAHRANNVRLLLSTGVRGFSGRGGSVSSVELDNGEHVETDAVIVGVGVLPNTSIADAAGLDVGNGIIVSTRCVTSDPDIYAIGDCTWHPNPLLGRDIRLESVQNALEQAKTAAASLCGQEAEYAQVPWFWSDQFDLKLQIVGLSAGYDDTVIRGEPASSSFSCVYLKDGKLIAIDAVNSPRDFMQSKKLIAEGAVIDPGLLADASLALKDMARSDLTD